MTRLLPLSLLVAPFDLFTGNIVDSDPLAEYEVTPDPMYAGVDPETDALLPE
jgi:hypothetical protein